MLGVGVLVPVRLCALLAEELRASHVGELRQVRDAALAVAADNTARRLRTVADDRTLTVAQAAGMLRVTPGAVRQLLQSGALEGEKHDGRWRIPRAAVDRRQGDGERRGTRASATAALGPGAAGGRAA